jgi:hypothetical protein
MTASSPLSPKKHSFLVTLIDAETLEEGVTVVQAVSADDGLQEFLQGIATYSGGLLVGRSLQSDERFLMYHPVIVDIDADAAAHIPLVDPV